MAHRTTSALLIAAALLIAGPVFPQSTPAAPQDSQRKDASAPQPKLSPKATLDALFGRLAKAQDGIEAKGIADQIERIWAKSGSDTADLLMTRVGQAVKAQNYDLALDLLDSVVALEPQWAEAWNRRATVLFLREDYDGAMRDIRQTLALEPRHYGAIAGMSLIFQALDDTKHAFKAARAALAIYPHMEGAQGFVERHAREVDGEDL